MPPLESSDVWLSSCADTSATGFDGGGPPKSWRDTLPSTVWPEPNISVSAVAQTSKAPKHATSATAKPKVVVVTTQKMSGFVKGDAKGTSFVLGAKGGPYNVDAKGAKCTNKGKFTSVGSLKGGDGVTVTGTVNGKNVKATEIKVASLKSAKSNSVKVSTIKPTTPK